jgi:hypothetical protein
MPQASLISLDVADTLFRGHSPVLGGRNRRSDALFENDTAAYGHPRTCRQRTQEPEGPSRSPMFDSRPHSWRARPSVSTAYPSW